MGDERAPAIASINAQTAPVRPGHIALSRTLRIGRDRLNRAEWAGIGVNLNRKW
jgi:hypothetical protein